jgi:hypothetical protein
MRTDRRELLEQAGNLTLARLRQFPFSSIMHAKRMVRGDEVVQLIQGRIPEDLRTEIRGPKEKVIKADTPNVWREMFDSSLTKLLAST